MKDSQNNYLIDFTKVDILKNEETVFESLDFKLKPSEILYLANISSVSSSYLLSSFYAHSKLRGTKAEVLGYDLINIERQDITELRQRIGLVLKDQFLYENLDLLANLERFKDVFCEIASIKITADLEEWLSAFELDPHSKPEDLTPGEKISYAIVKSLIHQPEIIFLEDHFCDLEYDEQVRIMNNFLNKVDMSKMSIVMVQSNSAFIERYPGMILSVKEITKAS